jgi:hypothetical protein
MPIGDILFVLSLPGLLRVAWSPAVAAHDLNLIGRHCLRILHLEGYILDEESPDFIAETVCVEMTLIRNLS